MRSSNAVMLAVALGVVGCGGAAKPAHTPAATGLPEQSPEAGDSASPDAMDSRVQNIDELWAEIDRWSEEIGIRTSAGATPEPEDVECPDAVRKDECTDTCTIADSICSNADKICSLAAELQERSAEEKCTASRLSCDRARAACCRCND